MNQNNPTITTSFIISAFLMIVIITSYVVDSAPNTAIADYKCVPQKWTSEAYEEVVEDLLSELEYYTPLHGYSYSHSLSLFEETAYGYAECSLMIVDYDCSECLRQAGVDLSVECPKAVGAEMKLADCFMKYSNYPLV